MGPTAALLRYQLWAFLGPAMQFAVVASISLTRQKPHDLRNDAFLAQVQHTGLCTQLVLSQCLLIKKQTRNRT